MPFGVDSWRAKATLARVFHHLECCLVLESHGAEQLHHDHCGFPANHTALVSRSVVLFPASIYLARAFYCSSLLVWSKRESGTPPDKRLGIELLNLLVEFGM